MAQGNTESSELEKAKQLLNEAKGVLAAAQAKELAQQWRATFPPEENTFSPRSATEREQVEAVLANETHGDYSPEEFNRRFGFVTQLVPDSTWGWFSRPDWSHQAKQVGIPISKDATLVVRIGEADEGYGQSTYWFEIFKIDPKKIPVSYTELERTTVYSQYFPLGRSPEAQRIHDYYLRRGTGQNPNK